MKEKPNETNEINHENINKVKNSDYPIVVAIGASAGGLNAFEHFFKNTPPDTGLAYVVIQHLDPSHKSMLTSILQRYTNLSVKEVTDDVEIEKDTVYVIPPGNDMSIEDNHLVLRKQQNPRGVRLPIDYFFRSLMECRREKAIGIILSGTGSDGTLGLKAIKEENGMVMAQSPETADHKGMPQSAIETGIVDFVLPPNEMPAKLLEFIDKVISKSSEDFNAKADELSKQVKTVFKLLKEQTKHDFADYKPTTVIRRIERRMAVNSISSIEKYIEVLKDNPNECESLFKEFLIGVTSFFRDPEAFRSFEKHILPNVISKDREQPLRVWITGCSTGEEAYSIAMMIHKYRKQLRKDFDIQIFASDIDERALESARYGRYPLNIEADVPDEYLQSYFQKKNNLYQVDKQIRDMIVFANHSIIKDPPYSRVDIISCRNLLIYLKSEIQKRIIDVFHYSLKPNGFLFLGNSESLGNRKERFKPMDAKWKIFRKIENGSQANKIWNFSGSSFSYYNSEKEKQPRPQKISLKDFAQKAIQEHFMYPFLIIDKDGEIQYAAGKIRDYFSMPQGEPSNNILSCATDGIKVPLANALRKIKMEKKNYVYDNIRIVNNNETELVKITFAPINEPAAISNLYIVTVEPSRIVKYASRDFKIDVSSLQDQDEYINNLETELKETRHYLQSVIEELETSNEELKSANEEAQSSNEELQSTNEELETSKEELQSLNEELETSNHELQRKISEISQINNDINNFITSTQIGVIFLDKDLIIQRFTPSMRKIIDLLDSDVGRPVANFVTKLNYRNFVSDVKEVLETLVPKEVEVSLEKGEKYWMRILPYRTIDDKIDGTVITFTDITEHKKIQAVAEQNKERFMTLFENLNSGVYVMEVIWGENGEAIDGIVTQVNDAYTKQTGIEREKIVGKKISQVFPNFRKDLFHKTAEVVKTRKPYVSVEYSPSLNRHFRMSVYSFEDDRFIAIIDDISAEIIAINKLKKSEEKFRSLFNNMAEGICICSMNPKSKKGKPEVLVESINGSFTALTGLKSNDILEQNLTKKLDEIKMPVNVSFWNKGKKELVNAEIEWESENIHLFLTCFPIEDNQLVFVIQDITKEKNELIARNRLASIVESSEDAIYSVNLNGEIMTWNKGAEKFYGYKEKEILGKHVSALEDGENGIKLHKQLIAKVKSGNLVKNYELVQKTKSGKQIPVALTKSPVKNHNNEIVGISNVVKDITKIKNREYQLIQAKRRSEEAVRLKTAFFQNISHEIRTPMNSIIGYTELLKSRIESDGSSLRYVNIIEQSGRQLLRLIDDILDISRLDSGETFIAKTNFNLKDLLHQSYEQFVVLLQSAEKEHLKIKLNLPDDDKTNFIYTDKYRLQQIIDNLVSNAVKYTDKGHIEFGYNRDGENLLFFVNDTGRGMKKEDQKRIFDRFQRVESETSKVFSGAGLGLSISKGLTEMLNGEIWCESELGKGSTFYLRIPYEVHEEEEKDDLIGLEEDLEIMPKLEGKTILIAEDDDFSSMMLEAMLKDTGAALVLVSDGHEAIKKLKSNNIDIALLDIRLPGKSGFKILEEVKENSKTRFIAQTAYAMPENKKEILDAGFEEFLEKPLTRGRLFRTIKKLLN